MSGYAFSELGKRLLVTFSLVFLLAGATGEPVYGHSFDFTTDSFSTEVKVEKDNSLWITETIEVDFHKEKHGIYRYIPLEGDAYYRVGGQEVRQSRKMKIDKVQVDGYEYDTTQENGNYVIRVGEEDRTVSGKQKYRIRYRCRLYDDKISAYDIFYYNVLPQGQDAGWETSIHNASVHIKMPRAFDEKELKVFAGKYGSDAFSDLISVQVKDQDIRIRSKGILPQGAGVTVQQILPEGYFVNEMNTDWAYGAIFVTDFLSAVLALLLWLKFGRDKKIIRTVEFYPPENLTPADAGYILDGYVDRKDVISMILYFADKGYLDIEEPESGKLILHRKERLPRDANDFEETMMDGIFEHAQGGSVELSQLKETFYESYQKAAEQVKAKYKKRANRIFYKSSDAARIFAAVLMTLPAGGGILFGGIFKQETFFEPVAVVFSVGLFILYLIGMVTYDRKHSMGRIKFLVGQIVLFLLAVLGLAMILSIVTYFAGFGAGLASVSASAAAYLCARQMRKRTDYGNEITGKLLGFRRFLETAEVKRLEALVDENPAYFYHNLSYAYVMGLSDKWADRFASVAVEPPGWYHGDLGGDLFNTILFMNVFRSCTNQMQETMTVPAASGEGTGSGGFSGGGFSGGGFGGGGGGAW